MATYNKKSEEQLVYNDNKRHVTASVDAAVKSIRESLLTEAMDKMTVEFNDALPERLVRYGTDPVEIAETFLGMVENLAAIEAGSTEAT